MKQRDLKKLLKNNGATFEKPSKGNKKTKSKKKKKQKHQKVYCNGKQTVIPNHREISDILVKIILKQLDINT